MMLEKQLATPELCNRIAELGGSTETAMVWGRMPLGNYVALERMDDYHGQRWPAYSVPELLEMLDCTVTLTRWIESMVEYNSGKFEASARSQYVGADTAADALAKLYIALHESHTKTEATDNEQR